MDQMLYEGKAKKVFKTEQANVLKIQYKDSLTALNAQKLGSFVGKGTLNKKITTILFHLLKEKNIPTHWIKNISENEMLVHKLKMIPLEVVIRNVLAGSTAKKFGIKEGYELPKPLVEFYYKKDELSDPFASDDQLEILNISNHQEMKELKELGLKINEVLLHVFNRIGIRLVDFKIEFGRDVNGSILLGDEITPDCCRLWDFKTNEKLDKDRFRRDLGKVAESYQEVFNRLIRIYPLESEV